MTTRVDEMSVFSEICRKKCGSVVKYSNWVQMGVFMVRRIVSSLFFVGLVLAAFGGPAWIGHVNLSHAYIYGVTDVNKTDYPLSMKPGVKLCYTTAEDEAVYVDETSAYAAKRDKNVFYFVANIYRWEKDRSVPSGEKDRISTRREVFAYDVDQHQMYRFVNDQYYALPERAEFSPNADARTSLAIGMQIWHAVRKQDWQPWVYEQN